MRTDEELKKLASLERMSIECLDSFIDHRIQRGDSDGVPLRRFTGHVAHFYNIREYIGRTENQLFDFFFARSHLWRMDTDGLIGKISAVDRLLVLESAVYINNQPKKRADICSITKMLRMKWPSKSWSSDVVETTLDACPELFKVELGWLFECRVSTVEDVILPGSLFSSHNASHLDGILNKTDDDRYSTSTNSESTANYGGGDPGSAAKYGSERYPYLSSGAATAAPLKIEGIGRVVYVGNDFAIAYVDKVRVHCYISKFVEKFEEPLSKHISDGDELYITEVVVTCGGRYAGKWKANRVSTRKPPSKHDYRARDRSDATDRHRGTAGNRAVSPDHRRRSKSPPIARSTKPKQRETTAVNDAGASYAAAAQGAVRSVHDRVEPMIKKEADKSRLVDVGVQTEVTDDELLLRVLRRFPQLLDGLNMEARQ